MRVEVNTKPFNDRLIQQDPDPEVERWSNYIENFNGSTTEIPEAFFMVETLVSNYLKPELTSGLILDIGCETGKNAIPLIEAGYKVTLLDIAPNAIQYTKDNLETLGLESGIEESIIGKIETLDPKHGPFKAVVGTYVFSFIPPNLFDEVMKKNILGRVEQEGYFVGGFFGKEHSWAKEPNITAVTIEKLNHLFKSAGFSICEVDEHKQEVMTTFEGKQLFHIIAVIAQQTLKSD